MKDNHDPTRMNEPLLLGRIVWHLVRQLGGQAMIPADVLAVTADDHYRITYSNLVERVDGKAGMIGDSVYLESFDLRELEGWPDNVDLYTRAHSVCERALAFFEKRAKEKQ